MVVLATEKSGGDANDNMSFQSVVKKSQEAEESILRSFGEFGMESSKSKGKQAVEAAEKKKENQIADFDDLPSGSFESVSQKAKNKNERRSERSSQLLMGQSLHSSRFDLDNDKDDFAGLSEHADKGPLLSDRIHHRNSLNGSLQKSKIIDFNQVHKLKDIKEDAGHESVRPSEVSVSKKLGLDSSMAMSNHLKNFDDFGDSEAPQTKRDEEDENLDSDDGDDSPQKNKVLDLSQKIDLRSIGGGANQASQNHTFRSNLMGSSRILESQASVTSAQPNQISFVINLEPNDLPLGHKPKEDGVIKSYKSAVGIVAPNEDNPVLKFIYFKFDVQLKDLTADQLKSNDNMVKNASQQMIKIPMAIKGFLSGNSQSGGAIVSIIDLDTPSSGGSNIEKYLVILMEQGLVVLLIKYQYGETAVPTISLIKQAPKLIADCTCANLTPPER